MEHHMMEIGNKENYKVMVYMFGLMEECIKENGWIIQCMVKVFIHGMMVEDIKAIIIMIRKKDMANISGQMGNYMMVIGKMENKMEREN